MDVQGARSGRSIRSWPPATGRWASGRRLPQVYPDDARAALLGAQDGQRAGQAAQAVAARGQGEAARDLDGRRRRADADKAFDLFLATYEAKYPKAAECLAKDRDVLLDVLRLPGRALDAPADDQPDREHVRHGAAAASTHQGQAASRTACLTMVFKLMQSAAEDDGGCSTVRNLLPDVIAEFNSSTESNPKPPPEISHPQLLTISPAGAAVEEYFTHSGPTSFFGGGAFQSDVYQVDDGSPNSEARFGAIVSGNEQLPGTWAVVPEPTALSLGIIGATAFAGLACRRRKRTA